MEATPPGSGQPQQRSWWGRNALWAVPLGCLGFISIIGAFAFAVLFLVYGALKSSDPYRQALATANADARVVRVLGSPIDDRFFTTGSFNTSGPTGQAEFALPVRGPKGNATIFVKASKSLGEWNFDALVVEITSTHERIDLLRAPSSSTPAPRAAPAPEQASPR